MRVIKDAFKNWTRFDYILYIVAMILMVAITVGGQADGWIITMVAAFSSLTAGMLNYKGHKLGFMVYIAYALLYTYMSLTNHLYGEAILYGIYAFPMYTISTVKWMKEMKREPATQTGNDSFEIYSLKGKGMAILIGLVVAVTIGYGYSLSLMGSDLPYLNSLGTACSASAIYMTNKRYKEQWYAWLSYSFVFAAIWINKLTLAFVIQSAVFIIINICGLMNWRKAYENQI